MRNERRSSESLGESVFPKSGSRVRWRTSSSLEISSPARTEGSEPEGAVRGARPAIRSIRFLARFPNRPPRAERTRAPVPGADATGSSLTPNPRTTKPSSRDLKTKERAASSGRQARTGGSADDVGTMRSLKVKTMSRSAPSSG